MDGLRLQVFDFYATANFCISRISITVVTFMSVFLLISLHFQMFFFTISIIFLSSLVYLGCLYLQLY